MYSAFRVDGNAQLVRLVQAYKPQGAAAAAVQKLSLASSLKKYAEKGVIDGSGLSGEWFPSVKCDVFLSYSHEDRELALQFAGYLSERFDLNVFLDASFWGGMDRLLRELNDECCATDDGAYDYDRVLLSSAHVHAMLTVAIMKVMDKAEAVFFLNTPSSVPTVAASIQKTASPWIYEELMLTQLLRRRPPLGGAVLEHSTHFDGKDQLRILYDAPVNRLAQLTPERLARWDNTYQWAKEIYPGISALSYLYEIFKE